MSKDIITKHCIFHNRINSLLQEFNAASPSVLMKCVHTYASSFTSSQIWDLFSTDCEKLFKSWNVLIRQTYRVDRCTHKSLIENISDTPHLKTQLCCRFVKFALKILGSSKFSTRFLSNLLKDDNRTVFGRNLVKILKSCEKNVDEITSKDVRDKMRYWIISDEELWRQDICKEILSLKEGDLEVEGFFSAEIEEIFRYICTS